MEVTSRNIWEAYLSSNWQGPLLVSFLGVIAATINGDFPLLGLGAGLYALVFSHLISLLVGVPLLFTLKATNYLNKNTVILAGLISGSVFAVWFYVSVPLIIYPLSALVCGIFAGWFASKTIFKKSNNTANCSANKT